MGVGWIGLLFVRGAIEYLWLLASFSPWDLLSLIRDKCRVEPFPGGLSVAPWEEDMSSLSHSASMREWEGGGGGGLQYCGVTRLDDDQHDGSEIYTSESMAFEASLQHRSG